MNPRAGRPHSLQDLRRLAPDAACVGLLWLMCLAFLWPLVTPDASARLYFGRGDLSDQFFAFRSFSAGQLWAGDLPLWNPGIYAGHPALADIQSAVFYPLSLLATLLAGPGGPTLYALQVEILADFWLGALFMYLFAPPRHGAAWACRAGVPGLCPRRLPHLLPAGTAAGAAGLDLAAVGALLCARRLEPRWAGAFWSGDRLGRGRSGRLDPGGPPPGGHAQLLHDPAVPGLWPLARGTGSAALAGPAVAALVGLGIGAVQWMPTVEFMAVSTRAVMPFDDAQAGFPLGDVLTPFFPGFIGRSAPLYVGLLPLLLAAWRSPAAS